MKMWKKVLVVFLVFLLVSLLYPGKAQGQILRYPYPGFWHPDCRVELVRTQGSVTILTGYWGGWYWYHYPCCWLRPYLGPIWWQLYYPYWHSWMPDRYRPYSVGNLIKRYPWWGKIKFYGFKDKLTFQWWYWKPRVVWWWSWYPRYPIPGPGPVLDVGRALDVVTLVDERQSKILPLDTEILSNLSVEEHQFRVNGMDTDSFFDVFTEVSVADLPGWFGTQMHVTAEDVTEFTSSDLYQNLLANSTNPTVDKVGVEYAWWYYPPEKIVITLPPLPVEEYPLVVDEKGYTASYTVHLSDPPTGPVSVEVIPGSTEIYLEDGGGGGGGGAIYQPGEPMSLAFNPSNWDMPQTVIVHAVNDSLNEGPERLVIGHDFHIPDMLVSHEKPVEIMVRDNECGGIGFLPSDSNFDCRVNAADLLELRLNWLKTTIP